MRQAGTINVQVPALAGAVGLFTFVSIGVVGCVALVAALFYLVVGFVLLVSQAVIEMFESLASIWIGADPVLKLAILVAALYGGYLVYQRRKKGGAHA